MKKYNGFINEEIVPLNSEEVLSIIKKRDISEIKRILPLIKDKKLIDDAVSELADQGLSKDNDEIKKSNSFQSYLKLSKEEREDFNLSLIKILIEDYNADVHWDKDKAIRWASQSNQVKVVKYLVEKGSDINAKNSFPLRTAIDSGNYDVVEYLITINAKIDFNYLKKAVKFPNIFKLLMEQGKVKIKNMKEILKSVSNSEYSNDLNDLMKYLVDDRVEKISKDDLPFISSANLDFIKWLIFAGVSIEDILIELKSNENKIENFIKMVSSFEFQKELFDRDISRATELTKYINPKIMEIEEYANFINGILNGWI